MGDRGDVDPQGRPGRLDLDALDDGASKYRSGCCASTTPDVDLDSLSTGTQITVPKLRQRNAETSARDVAGRTATAG